MPKSESSTIATRVQYKTIFLWTLKDLAMEQIRPYVEAVPQSDTENVGITAIVALTAQLVLWQNSRSFLLLGNVSALTLSSIAMLSFGAINLCQAFLGAIHDKETLEIVCKEVAYRSWETLK